ncbi:hypothetical protein RKD44_001398 [Streptomyces collinus]
MDRAPAHRGRTAHPGAAARRRHRGAGAARTVERAQPRHRVRRPAVGSGHDRRRSAGGLRELRRPAAVRLHPRRRRAAPADPALPGGRRAALDRAGPAPRARRGVVRPGGVHRRGAHRRAPRPGGGAAGRLRRRRPGRGPRTRPRAAPLRHRAPSFARRAPRRLARLGPPAHALGRHRADRRRGRPRGHVPGRPDRRRRARGVDRPGGLGPGRQPAVRLRPHRLVEPLPATGSRCAPARRSSAGRCGSSGSAGSRPWTAGSSRYCTAAAPPSSAYSTPRPARSSTPRAPGPSSRPPSPRTGNGSSASARARTAATRSSSWTPAPAAPG